jgi:hypothetical protein
VRACGDFGGSLQYARIGVRDKRSLESTISGIASKHSRLDGSIAAAGIQRIKAAVEYTIDEIREVLPRYPLLRRLSYRYRGGIGDEEIQV